MIPKDTLELIQITAQKSVALEIKTPTNGTPHVILADGRPVDLSPFYPPARIKQAPTFIDSGSFVEYVNRFKTDETLIFAKVGETEATFTAVLDYHAKDRKPDYCAHRATFTTLPTPEWAAWQKANRKSMDQVEFATWLEDNLNLFVQPANSEAPSGAELLELVKSLHGHKNARFNTSLRLNNGAYSVDYEEDVIVQGESKAKPGAIELPKEIIGGFAIFQGGDNFAVPARLKTRISERKLLLHFETIGVPQLIRDNLIGDAEHPGIVAKIASATGIMPLLGTPN
jgi:uncharacterized protein YfdQ (DUF2303 family)